MEVSVVVAAIPALGYTLTPALAPAVAIPALDFADDDDGHTGDDDPEDNDDDVDGDEDNVDNELPSGKNPHTS